MYDAWGNLLQGKQIATGGNVAASINPFRYRGYYFDTETGYYYLNSRYYNPQWGRFLNADGYVSTGTGLLGFNMYAYCNNNPIMHTDPTGELIWTAIVAVIGVSAMVLGLSSCSADDNSSASSITDQINLYDASNGSKQEGKINVKFSPNGRTSDGKSNPSFQIEDSAFITDKKEQRAILEYIVSSDFYDQELYGRTVDSMLIEWDAHNRAYELFKTDRFRHTDFDKLSEGKKLLDYVLEYVLGQK